MPFIQSAGTLTGADSSIWMWSRVRLRIVICAWSCAAGGLRPHFDYHGIDALTDKGSA